MLKARALTLFIVLVGAAQRVLRWLAGRLAVLLPYRASTSVGAGHGGKAEAVGRGGCAHCADGCLALVGWTQKSKYKVKSQTHGVKNFLPRQASFADQIHCARPLSGFSTRC